ncbi:ROK family transcriptional regulator [Kitasatospora paracochleata]|uniref:NBD/HSP70 family sugar kinase n=3 Tax=Kitasatospora paracochleata TaxID=58354 RepID=A0ABT1J7X8_9ACTN|nr:ROK family transcriptional regulator [Kitasatospora paracochleata]MCP2313535.1 putative NBD/HSP70 family sugar kinase [Kitasatospora paracochleata]
MTTARTATPSTARAINDRLALDLLLEQGPLTASELRTLTGLSRPTVADLLDRLQRGGLVAVAGESADVRRGPNARVYALVADRAHLAGIDIRATGVSLVVADLTGRTLATAEIPAGPGDADDLAARTVETLLAAAERAGAGHLHTVAVGAPGLVDPASGELNNSGKLPRWHTDLLEALRARPGTEVILENEVNLAGIAEHRVGAARDRADFALLWLGHGIGASVVLGGRLRRGASGGTGEIGFLPVPGTVGLPSATGCEGGFHSVVASAAICALARRYGLAVPGGGPLEAAVELVGQAVRGGADGAADGFLEELAGRIALGVSAICVVLDPGCVVLGGEVGQAGGAELASRVERRLAGLNPLRTEVRAGTAGGGAVLAGAVLTAGDAVRRELFGGV